RVLIRTSNFLTRPCIFVTLVSCRYVLRPDLPSFPTRRSSDLTLPISLLQAGKGSMGYDAWFRDAETGTGRWELDEVIYRSPTGRSEEHTSELHSRENLVCRLLLEKKTH